MGVIRNAEPIELREFAESVGASLENALDVFDRWFGGYINYVRMCDNDPQKIAEIFDRIHLERN